MLLSVWCRNIYTLYVIYFNSGCKIFGTEDVYIVLEEDGTEIEDNAALVVCKDKTLQVLSKHQSWYKDTYLFGGRETIDLREGRGTDEGSEFGTVRGYPL
jgi:hypothetical protein